MRPHPFILGGKSAVLLDFALTRQQTADMNFVTYSGILLLGKGLGQPEKRVPGVAIEQRRGHSYMMLTAET